MAFLKNVSEQPLVLHYDGVPIEFPPGAIVEVDSLPVARDFQMRLQLSPSTKHNRPVGKHRLELHEHLPEGGKVHQSHKFIPVPEKDPPHREDFHAHGKPGQGRAPGQHPELPYEEVRKVEEELIWRHGDTNPDAAVKMGRKLGVIKKATDMDSALLAVKLWEAGVRYKNEQLVYEEQLDQRKWPKEEPKPRK